jgi:hypothetical protein
MENIIKLDDFIKKYKPIKNHITNNHTYLSEDDIEFAFETYGEELDFVLKQDDKNIWTISDQGYINNGYWLVNRLAYIVCENKWQGEKGHIEITNYYEE